jgi:DNA mismatch repair protein MutS
MLIDGTTLADLAVFQSPDGSEGVFALVDRTHTRAGRAALRDRFETPASDVASIRGTQEAVRWFMRHPTPPQIDDEAIEAVTRYLDSNIELSRRKSVAARLEVAWMKVRYRDVLAEIREGIGATAAVVGRAAALSDAIRAEGLPPVLSDLLDDLERAILVTRRVLSSGGGILEIDRALRGEAAGALRDALGGLAELDALQAMARATSELGWRFPELLADEAFHLEASGLYHPFVESPVKNPVRLTGGEPMVFLTGPNMAGKTTYLRAVGLVVLLAQVGMGVPADAARLTPVQALFTSLNPADNLRAGLSYFLVEVLRVKAAASLLAEGRRALVLFDEVFKGTNVKDALEASAQVILGFARARRSGFVFSSHLAELAETLATDPSIRFCYFDGEILRGVPHYGYSLKEGVSDKRFGLLLLRQARIPELIDRIGSLSSGSAP